jgi:dipeptidyl aminopeptidase/acylaminoacyl peptidase
MRPLSVPHQWLALLVVALASIVVHPGIAPASNGPLVGLGDDAVVAAQPDGSTFTPVPDLGYQAMLDDITITGDGNTIVATGRFLGDDQDLNRYGVWTIDRATGAQTLISDPDECVRNASVSADGTRVAFVRWPLDQYQTCTLNGAREDGGLYVMNIDGSGEHRLVDGFLRAGITWSPDSTTSPPATSRRSSTVGMSRSAETIRCGRRTAR